MDVVSSYAWIGWLVLILVFITIEMLSLDFVFLMLAIGSLGGLISGLFGFPWWAQLLVAAVLSILLLFLLRPPLLKALRRGEDPTKSNVALLLGQEGRVVQTFGGDGKGLVRLANGEVWTSRLVADAADQRAQLEPGALVHVKAIEGATAVVAPAGGSTR
ncbi:NfeD family protein [Planctomonas sp. JC2975]|uniref:NfeD family protein n=1 Tax=Planctomonas sp. JC2975 TaxID=2729626 RepID=UPI0014740AB8|nr:NfeD family protein [Planctomonas sp. JC2975]NNC10443.1 NfeD family protein [Planctomonas sp. JC2975]